MLIKKQNLAKIKMVHHAGIEEPDIESKSITLKATELELHKARQEAKIIKKEAEKILKDAQNKLTQAEKESIEILEGAEKEAHEIKQTAYKEAVKRGVEETNILKTQAKELISELFEVKRKALEQAHKQILNIALDLTEKIIKKQVSVDPATLKTQVMEAIKKATMDADNVKVFVNPQDLKLLEESISELKRIFPSGMELIPFPDELVDPGSCIIETKSGRLDARFSTQLEALRNLVTYIEVEEPSISVQQDVQDKIEFEEHVENLQTEPLEMPQELQEKQEKSLISDQIDNIELPINIQAKPEDTPALNQLTKEEQKIFNEELLEDAPIVEEDNRQQTADNRQQTTDNRQQATDNRQQATGNRQQATGNRQQATDDRQQTTDNRQQIADDRTDEAPGPKPQAISEEKEIPSSPKEIFNLEEQMMEEFLPPPPKEEHRPFAQEEVPEAKKKLSFKSSQEEDEETEEEEKVIDTSSILKPKKDKAEGKFDVSSIAKEVEKDPEWKNQLQNEDED